MNCTAGMMMPLMNWAPKLVRYNSSLYSVNCCSTSRCRPNTLTSEWPEKASSMCPFSLPVVRHCATNSFCDLAATNRVISIEAGTLTSAITASTGEIATIMLSTATMVSNETSIWLNDCCRLCATLSMSLVTRLSTSPRGWPSK